MRICSHLDDAEQQGDTHAVEIKTTGEHVVLCDICFCQSSFVNVNSGVAAQEDTEWNLCNRNTDINSEKCKKVFYSITNAEVTYSCNVYGKSDEEILEKARSRPIDIYIHNPNAPIGASYRGKEDAGCDSWDIDVAFSPDDFDNSPTKDDIIEGLLERLYDVCYEDEDLWLRGKKLTSMEKLRKKYLHKFYIIEGDFCFDVKFSGEFLGKRNNTVAKFFTMEFALLFSNAAQEKYDKDGKVTHTKNKMEE